MEDHMHTVTAEQMAEIDRRAREEYGVSQSVLMENAGRAVADTIIPDCPDMNALRFIIFAGKGNNGGDGFVAARYLSQAGAVKVEVVAPSVDDIKPGSAKDNFCRMDREKIAVRTLDDFLSDAAPFSRDCILVDAVFGTGFRGEVGGIYAGLFDMMNRYRGAVYAVDIPSGLDATTGEASRHCVAVSKTVTFGLAKRGFFAGDGRRVCGEILVADIGFPAELIAEYTESDSRNLR